jgi:ribosomal protein S18 acetylase RimI-like enzyme
VGPPLPAGLRLHQPAGGDRPAAQLNIRPATAADHQGIARVHVDSWKETYAGTLPQAHLDDLGYRAREAMWKGLDPKRTPTFLAEEADRVVGFVSGGEERSQDPLYRGELYAIYILRAYQGRGLGRDLIRRFTGALHELGLDAMLLWVLSENPSRAFYPHLGGEVVRTQPITIFGAEELEEVAYGWRDTASLRS